MNKVQFNEKYAAFLDAMRDAEAITKRELGAMSITLIRGIHGMEGHAELIGELDYVNRLLPVLTPMNRKLAVSFFRTFAGYNYDDKLGVFTKKNKAHYMEALDLARQLVAGKGVYIKGQCVIEPKMEHNIWGWAAHLKVEEPKVFNPEKVAKFIKNQVGLATGGGLSKLDVLAAVFDGGFTAQDVSDLMTKLAAEKEAGDAIDRAKGHKLEEAPM